MNFEAWARHMIDALIERARGATRREKIAAASVALCIISVLVAFHYTFGAVALSAGPGSFVVSQSATDDDIARQLEEYGLIRHAWAFKAALQLRGLSGKIQPGGYAVSKTMNAFEMAGALTNPDQVWVVIQEGLRKEQIGTILAGKLHWTHAQYQEWVTQDTNINWSAQPPAIDTDYSEGVYFPDTYLVPVAETPADAAKRLQAHFNEEFAPLASAALNQNIQWTTALKIASVIQREAGGPDDMPIIAGVIWNRLNKHMPLDVDATLQYARGDTGKGWWAPITPADKKTSSPYNTYAHAGLPPTPISNPGLDALKAAVYPQKTDCLYYLHDSSGTIHCSATYEGQIKNIRKYL